jgi:hypothetical protein
VTGRTSTDKSALTWPEPSKLVGSLSGLVVVVGFTVFHNVFILDIWFNIGPMMVAGALCGFCIVWSYRKGVADHSTTAWFRYSGIYAAEMVALGAVSLVVLRPEFTMAELMAVFGGFALITVGLAAAFCAFAMWSTIVLEHFRSRASAS